MNILLINHYAGSVEHGMEFRPFYLAREWVKQGHNVTIVACSYSHLRQKNPDVKGMPLLEEYREGVRYVWIKGNPYKGNGLGRIRNMLMFLKGIYAYRKEIVGEHMPDAVICSSTYPLDYYPARRIAQAYNAALVFELHDLWPLSPMLLGNMSPRHPYIQLMQKAENDWCKHVDKCISILPGTKAHLMEHGLDPDKFVYIPNGVDLDDWDSEEERGFSYDDQFKQLKQQEWLLVGYIGGHATSNALEYYVEASQELKDTKIILLMVGDGVEKSNLLSLAKQKGDLEHLIFFDSVPKKEIPELMQACDILYAGVRRSRLYEGGIGMNKIMDYMMAGKPIVFGIAERTNLVSQANCGVIIEPEDPKAIADAVIKLASLDIVERKEMGERGREYIREHHNYSKLAKSFITELESCNNISADNLDD